MEYLKICKLLCDLKTWFGIFENWFVFWELILWFENWFVFSKLICDLKTWFVFWKLIWSEVYVIWKCVGPLVHMTGTIQSLAFQLLKPHCSNYLQSTAFGARVINNWNSLPEDIVNASTIDSFKYRLDLYWTDLYYII